MRHSTSRSEFGFTILEILVSVFVVALLTGLSFTVADALIKKSHKAKCMTNLRSIHAGLTSFFSDRGHWPQMEADRVDFSEEEFFEFWIRETEPYGLIHDSWICPSDKRYLYTPVKLRDKYYGSYVVTRFDEAPSTPFRWNQPWAMERGDFHGSGVHILMPDGSVTDSRNPFSGR